MNLISPSELALSAAGVQRDVLDRCPTDRVRLVGLGTSVIIAAVMAAIAGMVSAAAVLGVNVVSPWPVVIGGLWGSAIFATDRAIVSFPAKSWLALAGRATIAVAIGVLTAEPIVVGLFHSEIDAHIEVEASETNDLAASEVAGRWETRIGRLDEEIEDLKQVIASNRAAIDKAESGLADAEAALHSADATLAELQTRLTAEISGTQGVASGRPGDGPIADQLRAEIDIAAAKVVSAEATMSSRQEVLAATMERRNESRQVTRLAELQAERDENRAQRSAEIDETIQEQPATGLIDRIQALEEIAATNSLAGTVKWLIRVVIMMLDLGPIALKVASMRTRHPYDVHLEASRQQELLAAKGENGKQLTVYDWLELLPDATNAHIAETAGVSTRTVTRARGRLQKS